MSDFNQARGTYSKLFEAQEKKQHPPTPAPVVEPVRQETKPATVKQAKKSSNRDTTVPRYHGTTSPSVEPTPGDDGFIEDIRKAVKQLGEKAATHRFTGIEKDELADLVFAYRKKGITTSENEITRIAVNYMLYDYHKNKQSSYIARVLERLHG